MSMSGTASVLSPTSAATTSASMVEWLTDDCFFDKAHRGKHVDGPAKAQNTPETLLEVVLSLAKSASVYSQRLTFFFQFYRQPHPNMHTSSV